MTPEEYGSLFFLLQLTGAAVLVIGGIVFVVVLV